MKLCEELQIALGCEQAVFYGVPMRRALEPPHKHRRFKLNGLWFEAKLEGAKTAPRIAEIVVVSSSEVGQVHMPRPAIVRPSFGANGNVILDDVVVTHRHFSFGFDSTFKKMLWNHTALDSGKPWVRPDGKDSLAVSEYVGEVAKLRTEVEDTYVATLKDLIERRKLAEIDENLGDPNWGVW